MTELLIYFGGSKVIKPHSWSCSVTSKDFFIFLKHVACNTTAIHFRHYNFEVEESVFAQITMKIVHISSDESFRYTFEVSHQKLASRARQRWLVTACVWLTCNMFLLQSLEGLKPHLFWHSNFSYCPPDSWLRAINRVIPCDHVNKTAWLKTNELKNGMKVKSVKPPESVTSDQIKRK